MADKDGFDELYEEDDEVVSVQPGAWTLRPAAPAESWISVRTTYPSIVFPSYLIHRLCRFRC
jgi:hypothetical protein